MSRCNIAIYLRVSKADNVIKDDMSNSISTQKKIIDYYVKEHFQKYKCEYYIDDGYSGMNYDRPQFKNMLLKVIKEEIDIIIVKDLSRLGREYIETGKYIKRVFPSFNVRFIAVNDEYDSHNASISEQHLIMPIKSFINECYSRDISTKVRTNIYAMRQEGRYVGAYVFYGYKKDKNNKNKIVIDKEVAVYVKMIYTLYIAGYSIGEIKKILDNIGAESPYVYKRRKNNKYYSGYVENESESTWSYSTINRILKNDIYIGSLVQGKRSTINYKIKKCYDVEPHNWVRVLNNHESIVTIEEFFAVKNRMSTDNRISKKIYMLSGRLRCNRCNNIMIRRKGTSKCEYICSEYNRKGVCIRNGIKEDNIENLLKCLMDKIMDDNISNKVKKIIYSMYNLNNEYRKISLENIIDITARCYIYLLNMYISNIIVSLDKNGKIVLTVYFNGEFK